MQIYLQGHGNVDVDVYKAHMAAKAYDERCSFERNPETGQWCIYIVMPRGWDPPKIPVRGWESVPHPEEITRWMHEHDTARHGDRLRTEMNERNKKRKEDAFHGFLDQRAGDLAEHIEHIAAKNGDHPFHKSFRKVNKPG